MSKSLVGAKRSQLSRRKVPIAVALLLLGLPWLQVRSAPAFRETAVIPSFLRADPHVAHFKTVVRRDLDGTQSLLLVLGSRRPAPEWIRWGVGDTVGLFLVKNSDPDLVRELAIASSGGDFSLEVECANSSSVVWSRKIGDYGAPSDSIKTYFDISSKRVLRQFEFAPLGVRRILLLDEDLVFSLNSFELPVQSRA